MLVSFFAPRALVANDGSSEVRASLEARTKLDFDTVYEAHFDFVYRVVARLGGQDDVEDLTQEVFLVVHRRLEEFRGDARITTWLFRIAYRVVGAHIRRRRLRRAVASWFGMEEQARGQPATGGSERMEEARRVRRTLDALSYEKRSALVLFEVEGWSAAEIAEMLDVPVGTVYTRLHHARSAFRASFEQGSKEVAP